MKIAQGIRPYIPTFGKISVKFSVLEAYTFIVAPVGVKFGVEEWTSMRNFTPTGPCRP